MSETHTILGIDFDREIVVLEDCVVPITKYLDEEGDECGKDEVNAFVCGDDIHGYTVIYMSEIKPRTIN